MITEYLLPGGCTESTDVHQVKDCLRCFKDQLLYGTTMYNTKTMQHIPVQHIVFKHRKVAS